MNRKINPKSLENLHIGRQAIYEGDNEKIRTNLSLSKSAREYLSRGGVEMSESIEFMIYCHSGGEFGAMPFGENWKYLLERYREKINPPRLTTIAEFENLQNEIAKCTNELAALNFENDKLYKIRSEQDAEIRSLKSQLAEGLAEIAKLKESPDNSQATQAGKYLHEIKTRKDLVECGFFTIGQLKNAEHRDILTDCKGNKWQCIDKAKLKLEWHDYYNVKYLFKGV